jgi:hypothetical protein
MSQPSKIGELVRVRAIDLEPGRRVRLPRTRELVVVIDVTTDEFRTCLVDTENGVYPCAPHTLLDAEDDTSEVMP